MLRNLIRYLLLLASVGILSILYNEYHMGMIFLCLAAIPFLLFALLSFVYSRIRGEIVSVVHVARKGEPIPISVQLHNPTIFPVTYLKLYLTYRNAYSPQVYKKSFLVSLDSKTKTMVYCNITSEFAGNLEVSLKAIKIYDYLKMFSLRKKQRGEVKVAVLPNYYELTESDFYLQNRNVVESDNFSTVKSGDDPSEVFAIREYREGDRLQRIHWKLSMKQDQLMIKEFADPLNCSVLLLLDLYAPEEENPLIYMDALMECALSLSYSLFTAGQLHYFSWYDNKQGYCKRVRVSQERDFFEAVDGILQTRPYQDSTDAIGAYLAEHPNDQYTDLFYVTGQLSDSQLDSLFVLKTRSRQTIYVNDYMNKTKEEYMSESIYRRTREMDMNLLLVDVFNVRRDLEQLRMG